MLSTDHKKKLILFFALEVQNYVNKQIHIMCLNNISLEIQLIPYDLHHTLNQTETFRSTYPVNRKNRSINQ